MAKTLIESVSGKTLSPEAREAYAEMLTNARDLDRETLDYVLGYWRRVSGLAGDFFPESRAEQDRFVVNALAVQYAVFREALS